MLRQALSLASPAGRRGRLSILIFHRVLAAPDVLFPDEPDAARFDEICAWVSGWFNVLPLDEAVERWRRDSLPERAMAITFDDGYADNHDVALPVLKRHRLPATFFVSTGFMGGDCMWNDYVIAALRGAPEGLLDLTPLGARMPIEVALSDAASRRAAIQRVLLHTKYLSPDVRMEFCAGLCELAGVDRPTGLMMEPHQVRALRNAGMQIGAHTVSHPILAQLDDAAARAEIAQSKSALEDVLGEPVNLFAFPNGRPVDDYTVRDVALVRDCGFDAAFSTVWGAARQGSDRFQLPRFTPWDRARARFGTRLLMNLVRH